MPNHVSHRLTVTGPVSSVAQFKDTHIGRFERNPEEIGLDFQTIIPRPPILDRTAPFFSFGPNGRPLLAPLGCENDILGKDKLVEATDEELAELEAACGYPITPETDATRLQTPFLGESIHDWYSWSVNHWGTKWNSYSFSQLDDHAHYAFAFDTAWSPPGPILTTLADKYPDLSFDVEWVDEGMCHAGRGVVTPGMGDIDSLYLDIDDEAVVYSLTDEVPSFFYDTPLREYEPEYVDIGDYRDGISEITRLATNFSCNDVGAAMSNSGWYPISGSVWSDDPVLTPDELYDVRRTYERMEHFLNSV